MPNAAGEPAGGSAVAPIAPAATPVDVLIPTCARPAALAVTLASLVGQTHRAFGVLVSDQAEDSDAADAPEVRAIVRVLRARGHPVTVSKHLPRRGMAEQRQYLLDRARAPHVLFLDDDVIVEPDLVARLVRALARTRCGFVGSAVIGLSYLEDERPHQQAIDFIDDAVEPEVVRPGTAQWERHHVHSAANLYHVARRLGITRACERLYRVAWVGGCVLYDTAKLRRCGGFGFWRALPREHCGEDVLAQLRVMARFGGCGLIPSGAYHQELPTTLPCRDVDAPKVLDQDGMPRGGSALQA